MTDLSSWLPEARRLQFGLHITLAEQQRALARAYPQG